MFDDLFSSLSHWLIPEEHTDSHTLVADTSDTTHHHGNSLFTESDSGWTLTHGSHQVVGMGDEWHSHHHPDYPTTEQALGANLDPAEFHGVGNPTADAQFWHEQTAPTSCAVVAQTGIYESITGQHLSEEEVCKIAQANGWYDPQTGTQSDAVGKILDSLGIPTEQHYNANLSDIADALERGDKVIVGLNANDVWHPLRDPATGEPIAQSSVNSGHAVWVTGMEQEPDGSVKLVLNDSGNPNGQMELVDAKDFLNAWHDFGNELVVAHAPEQQVTV